MISLAECKGKGSQIKSCNSRSPDIYGLVCRFSGLDSLKRNKMMAWKTSLVFMLLTLVSSTRLHELIVKLWQ